MLATDWSPYALAAIGLLIMGIGLNYLYKAFKNNFVQKLNVQGVQAKVTLFLPFRVLGFKD